MRRVDITGRKYGGLTVLEYVNTNLRGEAKWLCKCDCGTEKTYLATSFKYGKTKSCGCLHKEIISGNNNYQAKRAIKEHGEYISSNDPWYNRASAIIRLAKQKGTIVGFKSVAEFALYLKSMSPKKCPVFNKAFTEIGNGYSRWSPSIDKTIPNKGYVKGNIQIISLMANIMKQEATPKQLEQFAQWIKKS